ncbi:tyrosine-type recombinase/integrase [Clostridium intestinale]|uniref:tyrosine-type recombinase/integrase n=1 Tax=Clostridium intestinale TaxID=36845 RepID=UPI0028E22AAE|nr:tyrosine-type recombinase/integrase [Clostridium intestinale]
MLEISELEYTVEEYLSACDMKNLSKKTLKSYDQTLRLFIKYLEENYKIKDIKQLKKIHVENYILFTKDKGKYSYVANVKSTTNNHPQNRSDYNEKVSPSTVNNYLRNIKAFLNWCTGERIIKDNVAKNVKYLKVVRRKKEQITDEEYKRLISCLDATKFVENRDLMIINLIFDSGMRLGETLALTVNDIDLIRKTVVVNGDNAKGKKDRATFFSNRTSQQLRRWIQYKDRYMESDYLFPTNRGGNLKVNNFEKNFNKYLQLSGIKKNITPHALRNNFGRRFLLSGGDISILSRILGHSSIETTLKAYADLSDEDIRKIYNRHSPLENMYKD